MVYPRWNLSPSPKRGRTRGNDLIYNITQIWYGNTIHHFRVGVNQYIKSKWSETAKVTETATIL